MEAGAHDPFDDLWPPELRADARERCRQQGREAGLAQVAAIAIEKFSQASRDEFADDVARDWLAAHDAFVARAAAIVRSPEAVGRERLARRLATETKHSATVAISLLRNADTDLAGLPVGVPLTTASPRCATPCRRR